MQHSIQRRWNMGLIVHEEGLNQLFSAYQPNLSGDPTLSCFPMLSRWADLFGFLCVMVLRDCLCVVAVVIYAVCYYVGTNAGIIPKETPFRYVRYAGTMHVH